MLETLWACKPNLAQRRRLPFGCPDPQTPVHTTDHNGHITRNTYIYNITHTMAHNIPHRHITDHSFRSTCVPFSVGNTASPNSLPPPPPSANGPLWLVPKVHNLPPQSLSGPRQGSHQICQPTERGRPSRACRCATNWTPPVDTSWLKGARI